MSEALAALDAGFPRVTEDEGALNRSRWRRWLLYLLVFSPVIALGLAVAANAVDIPCWDGWERGEMWRRYYDGTLDFQYLYSPHIEHRMLFPRLLQLAYGGLFGGDTRAEIWTTFALVAATCLLLFRVLRHTLGRSIALWPAAFLVNALICCPAQYSDLLWPVQTAFIAPEFCLAAMLVAAISRVPVWVKIAVMVLLAEIGTHCFSQGLMLWPVAVCLVVFSPASFGACLRRRLTMAGVVLLIAAITIIAYFKWHPEVFSHSSHSYGTKTGERSSSYSKLEKLMKHPRAAREYAMRSLGNPVVRVFSRHPERAARDVGRVVFVLMIAAMVFLWRRRKDGSSWERLLPWTAAGCFAFFTAVLLGLARAGLSHDRAVMPRYIPMTIYLVVALVAFGAYAVQWWAARTDNLRKRTHRAGWGWAVAAAAAFLLFNLWIYGLSKMSAWRAARLEARAALVYVNLFDPVKHARIDNDLEFLRRQANFLHSRGLLGTPLEDQWGFGPFARRPEKLGSPSAGLHIARRSAEDISVAGHALLPSGRTASGVLITVRPPGSEDWQVIGFAEMRGVHVPANLFLDDVFGHGHDFSPVEIRASFIGSADATDLPDGDLEILCWALDSRRWEAYPIGGGETLEP